MIVYIQCFGQLRTITREKISSLDIPGDSSIKYALDEFVNIFGEGMGKLLLKEGRLRSFYSIQVDKKNIETEELDNFKLKENQTVTIIPFVAGG